MRRALALLASIGFAVTMAPHAGCHAGADAASNGGDASSDADDVDTGASWLGDAGLVVRPPTPRPLRAICGLASNPGDMPIGNDAANAALRRGYLDAAMDLGGGTPLMVRRDFRWQDIEPARGTFAFDGYDVLADEATARGVPLLGALLYGTTWARAGATDDYFPPDDPNDFAAYAAATAQHFHERVAAWEIWNEPNMPIRFWKGSTTLEGDPPAYGALLIAAHDAIRARVPEVPVLLGGTVFTPQLITGAIPWLEHVYAAHPDLASHFEIAGAHTYAFYPPERAPELGAGNDPPLADKIQMHQWLLAQHGVADKPLWITEIGWPVAGSVDEATQARFTVRATLIAAENGADRIFWYTLRDGPNPDPTSFVPEDSFGLLHHDGTPKPAYLALKELLALAGDRVVTSDAAPIQELEAGALGSDTYAVMLRPPVGSNEPSLVAAWTVTSPSVDVVFTADVASTWDEMGVEGPGVAAGSTTSIGPDVRYFAMR